MAPCLGWTLCTFWTNRRRSRESHWPWLISVYLGLSQFISVYLGNTDLKKKLQRGATFGGRANFDTMYGPLRVGISTGDAPQRTLIGPQDFAF